MVIQSSSEKGGRMPSTILSPIVGMDTRSEDALMQRGGKEPSLHVRDAVNVNIAPTGAFSLRQGFRQVTAEKITCLWQSPLHGDVFGVLGGMWGGVDTESWRHDPLVFIGQGEVFHAVLNNLVCVSGPAGVFVFNGQGVERLTIDTPSPPLVITGSGSLDPGAYGVAVSWLRGTKESAPSSIWMVDVSHGESLEVTLPMCLDSSVTGARIYLTAQNGGELRLYGDVAVSGTVSIPVMGNLGAPVQFRGMSPMPSGRYLAVWRGRLVVAQANVIRFSEAMAYHLHDEAHGFIQFPQRITFMLPVRGGLWVGQRDHVVFLSGGSPDSLELVVRKVKPPIPGSAVLVDAELLDPEISQGDACAVWLSENGYVVGTGSGTVVELHSKIIGGVSGESGRSVVLDGRVLTAVL